MKPTTVNKWLLPLLVVMCIALGAGSAWAAGQGLGAVGPLDVNGYPSFISDKPGLSLMPCLDPPATLVPVADPCALTGTVADPTQITFVSNFPQEFFYSNATAKLTVGADALMLTAVEGGFTAPLPPTIGQQVVFIRTRLRVNGGLVAGATYRATFPYGTIEFVSPDGTLKQVTTDVGCLAAPCGTFQQLLTAVDAAGNPTTGPFLQAVSPAPPVGYVGDPNILQTVTGSPLGTNFFRIERITGLGGTVTALVGETDQFNLWGKIFTGPAQTPTLTIERTSYTRNATGTLVNVFANSVGATSVSATVAGTTIPLRQDASVGRWFGQASAPAAQPGNAVNVTATNAAGSVTLSSTLVDEVTIDAAAYDPATNTLTVQAHSGDVLAPPLLTVQSDETPPVVLGTVASGALLTLNTPAPPAGVVVTSALGGSANRDVDASPGGGGGQTTGSLNLVSNLNPSEIAQPVTFTATIVVTGAPTGTITFKEGATVLGAVTVVNKAAAFTTSTLVIGSHTISASYSGDAVFAASTSNAVIQVVNKGTVTVTLGSNPNPSAIGQAVLFSASVTPATLGAGTPTGSVTFSEGGTNLGTVLLVGASASISVSTLGPGSHLIIATYSGDATFKAGVSPIYTQNLQKANSTTTVAVLNPTVRKVPVTLTATVLPIGTSAGGIVTFTSTSSNGQVTALGTATVGATGNATLTFTTPNNRGTFTITAAYGGNASLNASSGTTSLVIN